MLITFNRKPTKPLIVSPQTTWFYFWAVRIFKHMHNWNLCYVLYKLCFISIDGAVQAISQSEKRTFFTQATSLAVAAETKSTNDSHH